ncbi:hypothetical protein BpHYR1_052869 [Brachionus plicatilis]|uniref:Uncharacterized protein n=1 Tax=Brachionus plicatilis TaxID=10195 RepID=A0A3M7RIM7_BRAPC|nr:hypothetical protein BpHYR1_052869 [Brachionus plicatilis]
MDDGSIKTVPKFKQRIFFKNSGTVFYRIKFPVVNATAQTIHKVQRLTLKRCHTSIDKNVFSNVQVVQFAWLAWYNSRRIPIKIVTKK